MNVDNDNAAQVAAAAAQEDQKAKPENHEATTEQQRRPEKIRPERQKREVQDVSRSVCFQKMGEARKKLAGKPEDEQRAMKTADKNLASVDSFNDIVHAQEGDAYDLKGGNPLFVSIDGQKVQVVGIKGTGGETLTCEIVATDGSEMGFVRDVPRNEVFDAQLLSEQSSLLNALGPAERAAVELYIKQLQGSEDAYDPDNAEQTNHILERAANAAGILTTGDIKTFIETAVPAKQEGDTLTPHEQQQQELREKALQQLEGKNIADIDTTLAVLNSLGVTPEIAQQKIAEAKKALAKNPNDAKTKAELESWENAEGIFSKDSQVAKMLTAMQEGTLDKDAAKQVIEAFKTGNVDTLVDVALQQVAEDPNDDAETKAKKAEARTQLEKQRDMLAYAKNAGVVAAIILALCGMASVLAVKNLQA